jgi:hypothetical protein
MTTTSLTIHCDAQPPRRLALVMMTCENFCVMKLEIRPGEDYYTNNVDVLLPFSMLPRMTRAVDAFNAALAQYDKEQAAFAELVKKGELS